ncbi:hypothetical protein CDAR_84571 [Caerostris darwini]|uniref:Uncharacterized protein n=1 Tax=Caerostris darwini TaxID=1538125 RepID=A0AAV4RM14_9ARAC|nr:hypothetical protein CDAR_84571 [Caerostris darwini]
MSFYTITWPPCDPKERSLSFPKQLSDYYSSNSTLKTHVIFPSFFREGYHSFKRVDLPQIEHVLSFEDVEVLCLRISFFLCRPMIDSRCGRSNIS